LDRDIVHPDVEGYLDSLLPRRPAVVEEMEREAEHSDFPIVGPHVGRLLGLLTHAIGAQRVFELGSGYGYSTYWFADAVGPRGQVVHTDFAERNSKRARDYLGQLGLAERVRFEVGDALVALERERGPYDVIFCDIDKAEYPEVPALALPRLRQGGLLVFDNTLWYGRVAERSTTDRATTAIQRLNRDLHGRSDVLTTILPVRDGVSVSLKL
jgi:predicted O-methyltransferase YrrM